MSERLAGRFRNRGEALEDLRQVAALGLVKAVDRYDPARGAAFESYAVPTITGEIKRHFRDHMWTLHVPRRVQDLRGRVRAARQELAATAGSGQPTVAELAERTGMTEDEVRAGLEAIDSFSALSLDAELPGGDDGYTLSDSLGATDAALDIVVDRESVKPGLRCLPERERKILYMRFFRDMTQSRIAEDLGISQMHVSRLITRCCTRLRDQALLDPDDGTAAAGPCRRPRPGRARTRRRPRVPGRRLGRNGWGGGRGGRASLSVRVNRCGPCGIFRFRRPRTPHSQRDMTGHHIHGPALRHRERPGRARAEQGQHPRHPPRRTQRHAHQRGHLRADQHRGARRVVAEAVDVLGLHLERPVPGACRLHHQGAARRVLAGHLVQQPGRRRIRGAERDRTPEAAVDQVGHDPVGEPAAQDPGRTDEHRLRLAGGQLEQARSP